MERWAGKVALVTGASAGIGEAIVEELVKNGMKVIGLARRVERVEAIKDRVKGAKGELVAYKGDVSKFEEVDELFKFIEEKFGAIHVLINNAGIARSGTITDLKFDHLRDVVNVNLLGLTKCSQLALQLMKKTNVDDGHIININSICGHQILKLPTPTLNIYSPTKYAVTALTETIRQELVHNKSKTKVTSISPGAVKTEIGEASMTAVGIDPKEAMTEEMAKLMSTMPFLQSKDVADAVVYVLQTPAHVHISELTIKPVGETM